MTKREVSEQWSTNCWMVEHILGRERMHRERTGRQKSYHFPKRAARSLEEACRKCHESRGVWKRPGVWKSTRNWTEKTREHLSVNKVWPAVAYTACPRCKLKRVTSHSLPPGVQPSSSSAIAAQENLFSRVSVAFLGWQVVRNAVLLSRCKVSKDSWGKELQPRSVFFKNSIRCMVHHIWLYRQKRCSSFIHLGNVINLNELRSI